MSEDLLTIAGKTYASRLLIGTGKYKDFEETRDAIEASGAEIVTVALRRTNLGQNPDEPNLLDFVSPERYTILPNTAGCFNAEDAVRTCKLARELLDGHSLVKLEVLGDQKTLYPNIAGTVKAARELVDDGFQVMVYTNDDPIVAKELEDMGCVAVMPLGSLIGSGLGILNPHSLLLIMEQAKVPIIVDDDRAVVRRLHAVEDLHQRRLAGAVLTDQRMHPAGTDVQRDVMVGDDTGEALADPPGLEVDARHRVILSHDGSADTRDRPPRVRDGRSGE